MSFTHTVAMTYGTGVQSSVYSFTQTNTGETNVDESMTAGAADVVVAWAATLADVKSLLVVASVAMTLKTYAATVLKDTIALAAGVPIIWQDGIGWTLADVGFAYDFDQVKVSSATAGTFTVRHLYDAT